MKTLLLVENSQACYEVRRHVDRSNYEVETLAANHYSRRWGNIVVLSFLPNLTHQQIEDVVGELKTRVEPGGKLITPYTEWNFS